MDLVGATVAEEPGEPRSGVGDERKQEARLGLAELLEPLADLDLLALLHAGQRTEAAVGDRALEVGGGGDAELRPDERDPAGAEARHLQELEQRAGKFGEQVAVVRARSGLDQLADLLLHRGTDAGQVLDVLAPREARGQVLAGALDRLGRHAIRAHPERVLALDLEDVGDLAEAAGDGTVVHEHRIMRTPASG
jgi:hypothetical protein